MKGKPELLVILFWAIIVAIFSIELAINLW